MNRQLLIPVLLTTIFVFVVSVSFQTDTTPPSKKACVISPNVHFHSTNNEIYTALFGLINQNNGELIPTNHIVYAIGTHYGWKLFVHSGKSNVRVKEVFELPTNAPWVNDSNSLPPAAGLKTIQQWHSPSGNIATNEYELDMASLGNNDQCEMDTPYYIVNGDPQGKYKISLYVDSNLVKAFDFWVTNADYSLK